MKDITRFNLLPGVTNTTKTLVQNLINVDLNNRDAYFNNRGFHNHFVDAVLAAYALGANTTTINRLGDALSSYQKPLRSVDVDITDDNWSDVNLLGDRNHYASYLNYFRSKVRSEDRIKLIENYIFANDVNKDGKSMLSRLFSGLLHPIIRLGYSLEFDNDEVLSQALAMSTTHESAFDKLFDSNEFKYENKQNYQRKTSLQIFFELMSNDSVKIPKNDDQHFLSTTLNNNYEILTQSIKDFDVPSNDINDVVELELIREISYLSAFIYASGGYKSKKRFKPEFILVHVLNCSHFLSFILKYLPNRSDKRSLILSYFSSAIAIWISRGKPQFDSQLIMNRKSNVSDDEGNLWFKLINYSLNQNDEHVIKAMRTIAFYGHNFNDYKPIEDTNIDENFWLRLGQQHIDGFENRNRSWNYDKPGYDENWKNDENIYDE